MNALRKHCEICGESDPNIVRCVNERDELVAAICDLDTILRGMDPYGLYANGRGKEFAALLAKVQA